MTEFDDLDWQVEDDGTITFLDNGEEVVRIKLGKDQLVAFAFVLLGAYFHDPTVH